MLIKLLTILSTLLQTLVNGDEDNPTRHESTPKFEYATSSHNGGKNFISVPSSHVTGIELGLCDTGDILTINILGDEISRIAYPNGSCSRCTGTKHTLSVGTNELVTKIEVWHNNNDRKWYRAKLTLNTTETREYSPPGYDSTND